MLCLFRNTKIHPSLNRYTVFISMLAVFGWLYFTFIHKDLLNKLFAGQALIVDLVFGLPLVLALAVVVYATSYWFLKLAIILLIPQAILKIEPDNDNEMVLEEQIAKLEQKHGKQYWKQDNDDQSSKQDDKPQHDK